MKKILFVFALCFSWTETGGASDTFNFGGGDFLDFRFDLSSQDLGDFTEFTVLTRFNAGGVDDPLRSFPGQDGLEISYGTVLGGGDLNSFVFLAGGTETSQLFGITLFPDQIVDTVFFTRIQSSVSTSFDIDRNVLSADLFGIPSGVDNPFDQLGLIASGELVSVIPEPATWLMMIIGFAGVGLMVKRRRKFEIV
jgi:hypothetical protein